MADINYWLGRKYDILQQQADAEATRSEALAASLANRSLTGGVAAPQPASMTPAASGRVPSMPAPSPAAASEPQTFAPRFIAQGVPTSTGIEAVRDPSMGITGIGDTYRQSAYRLPLFTTEIGGGMRDPSKPFQFAKGTARVPGKGDPRKDTVPAKLAPGEAVLNKPAADMAGRGLIAALNKLGAQKMGMP